MPSLKEIKQRINSVTSTRQVTSAMKMVSAAKLQKTQQWILNARPYSDELDKILLSLASRTLRDEHPLLKKIDEKDVKSVAIIVVTADKGLCGAFNMNIIRKAEEVIRKNKGKKIELICVGKKGKKYFEKKGHTIREEYINFFNKLEFEHSRDIMNIVTTSFLKGKYDKTIIIFNEFKSAIQQNIVEKQLLPLSEFEESDEKFLASYLFEPEESKLLDELIKKHLDVQIWRVLLESSSAEQGARMIAMDAATDSAGEMIADLTLEYNHKRQDNITKEIIEVSSAAEAL